MFANLLQLITGRPPSREVERSAFVEEIHVTHGVRRNPRTEWQIWAAWVLIAIKHVLIIWVCQRYPVPFHQLWVNFPTWLLGALATGIYYGRTTRLPRPRAKS